VINYRAWSLIFIIIFFLGLLAITGCNRELNPANTMDPIIFPKRSVSLIVPFAAGGGTDLIARALAKASEKHLGQSITVVNRTGGSGSLGLLEGASAKKDGYTVTMLVTELSTLPHLGLLPINYKDFEPILMVNSDPAAITVRADSQWKTISQFLDYARLNPAKVKMGNAGTGSIWHLAAGTIEKAAKIEFNHIPFEGADPAITALLSGHIDAVPVSAAEVNAHAEAENLHILALLSDESSRGLPNIKTIKQETGLELNYHRAWRGIGVPDGTPDDIVKVLEDAFNKGIEEIKFKEYMEFNGFLIQVKNHNEFERHLKEQHVILGNLISGLQL
jgi:tripartite-type tricarboxylate transporter receptor subunit TctC